MPVLEEIITIIVLVWGLPLLLMIAISALVTSYERKSKAKED